MIYTTLKATESEQLHVLLFNESVSECLFHHDAFAMHDMKFTAECEVFTENLSGDGFGYTNLEIGGYGCGDSTVTRYAASSYGDGDDYGTGDGEGFTDGDGGFGGLGKGAYDDGTLPSYDLPTA